MKITAITAVENAIKMLAEGTLQLCAAFPKPIGERRHMACKNISGEKGQYFCIVGSLFQSNMAFLLNHRNEGWRSLVNYAVVEGLCKEPSAEERYKLGVLQQLHDSLVRLDPEAGARAYTCLTGKALSPRGFIFAAGGMVGAQALFRRVLAELTKRGSQSPKDDCCGCGTCHDDDMLGGRAG